MEILFAIVFTIIVAYKISENFTIKRKKYQARENKEELVERMLDDSR